MNLANKSINTIMSQVANSNFNVDNILAFKKQQDKYNKMSTQVDTYFRKKQNQINQSAKETKIKKNIKYMICYLIIVTPRVTIV